MKAIRWLFLLPLVSCIAQQPAATRDAGLAHFRAGRYEDAAAMFERVLAAYRSAPAPDSAAYVPSYLGALNDFGLVRRIQGRYGEAEILYIEALSVARRLSGPESNEYATVTNNLGQLEFARKHWKPAERFYVAALGIWKRNSNQLAVADAFTNLGGLYEAQRKWKAAEKCLLTAQEIHNRINGPESPNAAIDENNLAVLASARGDLAAAEQLFHRALQLRDRSVGKHHPDYAMTMLNLAGVLQKERRLEEAQTLYDEALPQLEKAWGTSNPRLIPVLERYRDLLRARELYAEGERVDVRAMTLTVRTALHQP